MHRLKIISVFLFLLTFVACQFIADTNRHIERASNIEFSAVARLHAETLRPANSATVRGDFTNGKSISAHNVKVAVGHDAEGYSMTISSPDGDRHYQISGVVGTKRLEQYTTIVENKPKLLPFAFDLVQKRWVSVSSTFFTTDDALSLVDWETKCSTCHLPTTDSKVETIDFALPDSNTILATCGTCHSKGLTNDFHSVDLSANNSAHLIARHADAQLSDGEAFADGTVRFAAREYQALLRSVCFTKSKSGGDTISGERINCLSCHTLSGKSIDVKSDPRLTSLRACTDCHQQFSSPAAITAHTKHGAESAGSNCYGCHMPEFAYGHLRFQRSHQISTPDPELTTRTSAPNACNLCHADQSANWAVEKAKLLWPERFRSAKTSANTQFDYPEGVRLLFAGDAVSRALGAEAIARSSNFPLADAFLEQALKYEIYPLVKIFVADAMLRLPSHSTKIGESAKASAAATRLRALRPKRDVNVTE